MGVKKQVEPILGFNNHGQRIKLIDTDSYEIQYIWNNQLFEIYTEKKSSTRKLSWYFRQMDLRFVGIFFLFLSGREQLNSFHCLSDFK